MTGLLQPVREVGVTGTDPVKLQAPSSREAASCPKEPLAGRAPG